MDNQNPTPNPTPPTENISPQNPTVEASPPTPKSFLSTKIILLIVMFFILIVGSGTYLALNSKPQSKPAPPTTTTLAPSPSTKPSGSVCPSSTGTAPQTIGDVSTWKTYKNEEYGFEVKYPSVYVEGTGKGYGIREAKNKPVLARFCYVDTNNLIISVFKGSFKDYKLIGSIGEVFNFDTNKKVWETPENVQNPPKRLGIPFEAYSYATGEITATVDIIVVPHPSYSYVVEIIDVTHQKLVKSGNQYNYEPADFNLKPEQILSTFKFLNNQTSDI